MTARFLRRARLRGSSHSHHAACPHVFPGVSIAAVLVAVIVFGDAPQVCPLLLVVCLLLASASVPRRDLQVVIVVEGVKRRWRHV